jgi:hypothetical protein
MKKNLLATTALVAAGALVSTGAFAASKPISLKVGGYLEQWVGFGSADHDTNGEVQDIDVQEDGEIHFKGSTTLDNGLTFGVNVQLETQVQGDQIDEAYIFVKGDFGEIVLGSENGPAYVMHYGASTNGPGLNSGDHQNWIPGNDFGLASTYAFARRDNDSEKIRWMSPRFSGIQLGASYAPEATQDDDGFPTEATNGAGNEENVWAVAANYDNKFGDFRVRASLGYQGFGDSNTTGAENMWTAAAGLRLETGGFGVHLSGARMNDASATVETRDTIAGSVLYSSGPVGVSLGVVYGVDEGATAAISDKQVAVELGGKYKLGPGVEAKGAIYYGSRDDAGVKNTGFAVVGGLKLSF